jgi:hypothetical protein
MHVSTQDMNTMIGLLLENDTDRRPDINEVLGMQLCRNRLWECGIDIDVLQVVIYTYTYVLRSRMVTHTRMYIKSSIDIDALQVVVYVYNLRASTGVRNRFYLFHV